MPSTLVSKLKISKEIRGGVGKGVLSSKKLNNKVASLWKLLGKQLKTDYRIAGVSKERRPYSHCHANHHFDVFF